MKIIKAQKNNKEREYSKSVGVFSVLIRTGGFHFTVHGFGDLFEVAFGITRMSVLSRGHG